MLFYTQKIFTKIATAGILGFALLISPITYAQAPDPADTTDEDDDDQDDDDQDSVQEINTILRPPKLPENLEDVGTCDGDDDTTCEPDRPDPVRPPVLPKVNLDPPPPPATVPDPIVGDKDKDEDFCTLEVQTRPQVACVNAGAARYIRTNNIGHLKIVRSQITTRSASRSSVRVTRQAVQGGTADSFNGRGSLRVSLIAWTTVESVDQGAGNKFKYKTNSINQSLKSGSYLQRIFSRHSRDEHWLSAIQKRFRTHFSDNQESYLAKDKNYEDIQNQSRDITVLPPLKSRVYTLAYDPYVQANRGDALLACISNEWADDVGDHCRSDEITTQILNDANSRIQSRTSSNDWLNLKQRWGSEKIAEHNKKLLIAYFNNVYRKTAEQDAWKGDHIPTGEKPKLVYSTHFAIQSCASSDGIDSRGNTRTLPWPLEQDGMSHDQAINHLSTAAKFNSGGNTSAPKSPFSLIKTALDELNRAIKELKSLKEALRGAQAALASCQSANPPPPEPKPDCSALVAKVAELTAAVRAQEAVVAKLLESKLTKKLQEFMNEKASCYEVRTGILDEAQEQNIDGADDVTAYQPGWWEHTDLGFACKLLEEVAKKTKEITTESKPAVFEKILKELYKVLRLENKRSTIKAKNKSCSPNTDSLDVANSQPFNASGGSGSRPPRWHNILSSAILDMRQGFEHDPRSLPRYTQSIFVSSHPSAGFSVTDKKKFLMTQDPRYITFYSSEHYPEAEEYIPGLPMILIPGKKYVAPNIVSPNQNLCVGVHSSPLAMCELVNITLFRGRHGR